MKTSTPTTTTHASTIDTRELVHDSWGDVGASFDRFCVMAGIDAMKTSTASASWPALMP